MDDLSQSRSEIFQSPDNGNEIQKNDLLNIALPEETESLSYESAQKNSHELINNNQEISTESYAYSERNDIVENKETKRNEEEEEHIVNINVTIVAAFPSGLNLKKEKWF